jgi:hypothetical protein
MAEREAIERETPALAEERPGIGGDPPLEEDPDAEEQPDEAEEARRSWWDQ